ncbi:hypothetical protein H7169_02150 [Candidatus Gracilibacteria bacterium]|nr:hypothetical protein [Candidatus Gracilibacteria bacterium]
MCLITVPVHEGSGQCKIKLAVNGNLYSIDSLKGINRVAQVIDIRNGFATIPDGSKIIGITSDSVKYTLTHCRIMSKYHSY